MIPTEEYPTFNAVILFPSIFKVPELSNTLNQIFGSLAYEGTLIYSPVDKVTVSFNFTTYLSISLTYSPSTISISTPLPLV